ncbi:MAG: hypothetical protein JST00_48145 [Deltaproteobacteria bacterium]|nr:hypothetical protein [Deltaproteobacteria bacterium]
MKFDKLISRVRFLVLALPLFALGSTLHVGCSSSNSGGYYYGNNYGGYGYYGSSGSTSGGQNQPDPSNPFGE